MLFGKNQAGQGFNSGNGGIGAQAFNQPKAGFGNSENQKPGGFASSNPMSGGNSVFGAGFNNTGASNQVFLSTGANPGSMSGWGQSGFPVNNNKGNLVGPGSFGGSTAANNGGFNNFSQSPSFGTPAATENKINTGFSTPASQQAPNNKFLNMPQASPSGFLNAQSKILSGSGGFASMSQNAPSNSGFLNSGGFASNAANPQVSPSRFSNPASNSKFSNSVANGQANLNVFANPTNQGSFSNSFSNAKLNQSGFPNAGSQGGFSNNPANSQVISNGFSNTGNPGGFSSNSAKPDPCGFQNKPNSGGFSNVPQSTQPNPNTFANSKKTGFGSFNQSSSSQPMLASGFQSGQFAPPKANANSGFSSNPQASGFSSFQPSAADNKKKLSASNAFQPVNLEPNSMCGPKDFLFTEISDLTEEEKLSYQASEFKLFKIPLVPPPKEWC